jgi:ribosome-associated heat shock protein Hsp15
MRDTDNGDTSAVRLDKWLKTACVFKTRGHAAEACTAGHVKVNGTSAKPHRLLRLDDRIEIEREDWTRILVVKGLPARPVSRAAARSLYEDHSPARPPVDPLEKLLKRPPVTRARGSGRPTKKERRLLPRWTDSD